MEYHTGNGEEVAPQQAVKVSFFTRKLMSKLKNKGVDVPGSVVTFLDTPLCSLDEQQSAYFEKKFCLLIPYIVSALEEIFNEMDADIEGWGDMLAYASRLDTPIKICANAVLVNKGRDDVGAQVTSA